MRPSLMLIEVQPLEAGAGAPGTQTHGPDRPPTIAATAGHGNRMAWDPGSHIAGPENLAPPHDYRIGEPNTNNEPRNGQGVLQASSHTVSRRIRPLQEKLAPPSLNQQRMGGLNAGGALAGASRLPNTQSGGPLHEELKEIGRSGQGDASWVLGAGHG